MPDALPAATLAIYPGWGQEPNMPDCISSDLKMELFKQKLITDDNCAPAVAWC